MQINYQSSQGTKLRKPRTPEPTPPSDEKAHFRAAEVLGLSSQDEMHMWQLHLAAGERARVLREVSLNSRPTEKERSKLLS